MNNNRIQNKHYIAQKSKKEGIKLFQLVNIQKARKCAFCKHWYDPTNSAIKPKSPRLGIWEIDANQKRMCLKKNLQTLAHNGTCRDYECKL